MYYLMIKEIEQTGMKYLCKRKQHKTDPDDHIKYRGSGVLWRRILNSHPEYTIKTTVLGLYTSEELKHIGLFYSEIYNIIESSEWANLINEIGDGGDTSNTEGWLKAMETRKPNPSMVGWRTCHHPITEVIKRIPPNEPLPKGFVWGNVKGKGYGPQPNKTTVYHNGDKKIYVPIDQEPPAGFMPGVHYQGTTKGKVGYHNPKTKKKIYIDSEASPPEGFVRGLPPTTGKGVKTPNGEYISVQECMRDLNLTRYQIQQNINKNKEWSYI